MVKGGEIVICDRHLMEISRHPAQHRQGPFQIGGGFFQPPQLLIRQRDVVQDADKSVAALRVLALVNVNGLPEQLRRLRWAAYEAVSPRHVVQERGILHAVRPQAADDLLSRRLESGQRFGVAAGPPVEGPQFIVDGHQSGGVLRLPEGPPALQEEPLHLLKALGIRLV